MRDNIIDEKFVCKKYSPFYAEDREFLFKNFVQEIKLLHLVYHVNIVRVFSYFIYPEHYAGYILMEYIEGYDIAEYLEKYPQNINEIFIQTIEGFKHLESNHILHRDIRPLNILVKQDGTVKIIDFGFGKQVFYESDFDKSISLNWWCSPPEEFSQKIYNFTTEVYFVGKLFEKLITDCGIEEFQYKDLLGKMCQSNPNNRIESFSEINKDIQNNKLHEIDFTPDEMESYRSFANCLFKTISKIEYGTKYVDNMEWIQSKIAEQYKSVMLEENVPDNTIIIRNFINGTYYYNKHFEFPVYIVRDFLYLLWSSPREKKNIIISNIQTKLDSIPRYQKTVLDDDIPF